MGAKERKQLAEQTLVADAPGGKIVVHIGESSDAAYFILKGGLDRAGAYGQRHERGRQPIPDHSFQGNQAFGRLL